MCLKLGSKISIWFILWSTVVYKLKESGDVVEWGRMILFFAYSGILRKMQGYLHFTSKINQGLHISQDIGIHLSLRPQNAPFGAFRL